MQYHSKPFDKEHTMKWIEWNLQNYKEYRFGLWVGHIICSKAIVKMETCKLPVLNFGPLSVRPEYQHQGIGKALIREMIEKAKKLGYGAILFFGRPEYYPQFGFKEAAIYGISDAEGYNYPAFMAMELKGEYLKNVCGGKFFESDIYIDKLNRETVIEFDRDFEADTKFPV